MISIFECELLHNNVQIKFSIQFEIQGQITSPHFTIQLEGVYSIKTITVVNVHTGAYCTHNPAECISRINGAKVEVMEGLCYV